MATLIDWHAHHTAPELVAEVEALGGRAPRPDKYDGPDFGPRVAAMDAAGIALQLVCQGAGLNVDVLSLPPDEALRFVRRSNDLVAERVAPYPDRLFAVAGITYADAEGSAAEIERMAARGARAVMLYARPDLVGCPEAD